MLVKDLRLIEALRSLEDILGSGSFRIEDHWAADLLAIGISSPSDHGRLVYIALNGSDRFDAILEHRPINDQTLLSEDWGKHEAIELDELTQVIRHHLKLVKA